MNEQKSTQFGRECARIVARSTSIDMLDKSLDKAAAQFDIGPRLTKFAREYSKRVFSQKNH